MQKAELSPLRTNLLRLAYVPLALGLAIFQLPLLAQIGPGWDIMHGFVICMLSALCLLSMVGLFRPVTMLPLLLFEILWKLLWLALVGLPAWMAPTLDSSMAENMFAVALVLPIILLVPWDYVFRRIARKESGGRAMQAALAKTDEA